MAGLESQRTSQPGKPQNRLGNSRGEDGLLGQGREVRKGERQMGKQRRDCQGDSRKMLLHPYETYSQNLECRTNEKCQVGVTLGSPDQPLSYFKQPRGQEQEGHW